MSFILLCRTHVIACIQRLCSLWCVASSAKECQQTIKLRKVENEWASPFGNGLQYILGIFLTTRPYILHYNIHCKQYCLKLVNILLSSYWRTVFFVHADCQFSSLFPIQSRFQILHVLSILVMQSRSWPNTQFVFSLLLELCKITIYTLSTFRPSDYIQSYIGAYRSMWMQQFVKPCMFYICSMHACVYYTGKSENVGLYIRTHASTTHIFVGSARAYGNRV